MEKSTPRDLSRNMKTFINQANGGNPTITPDQAQMYTQFANNFYEVNAPSERFSNFYGKQIPINDLIDQMVPYYENVNSLRHTSQSNYSNHSHSHHGNHRHDGHHHGSHHHSNHHYGGHHHHHSNHHHGDHYHCNHQNYSDN